MQNLLSSIRSHRRRSAAESCSKLASWPLKTSLGSWPWKLPKQMAVPKAPVACGYWPLKLPKQMAVPKTSRLPSRGSWPWKLPNQMAVPKAPVAFPCLTVCSAYSPAGQETIHAAVFQEAQSLLWCSCSCVTLRRRALTCRWSGARKSSFDGRMLLDTRPIGY